MFIGITIAFITFVATRIYKMVKARKTRTQAN